MEEQCKDINCTRCLRQIPDTSQALSMSVLFHTDVKPCHWTKVAEFSIRCTLYRVALKLYSVRLRCGVLLPSSRYSWWIVSSQRVPYFSNSVSTAGACVMSVSTSKMSTKYSVAQDTERRTEEVKVSRDYSDSDSSGCMSFSSKSLFNLAFKFCN